MAAGCIVLHIVKIPKILPLKKALFVLTVVGSTPHTFGVAIIPYTYEHTIFHQLQKGDLVNIEFDMVGKYIAKMRQ